MTEYGSGGTFTVVMEGPFSKGGETAMSLMTINAPAANWKGGTSPYSQVVALDNISVNSKIDLQLSVEQLEKFREQEIAFTAENDGGVVTIYAIGDKPEQDCDFQVTVSEVIAV